MSLYRITYVRDARPRAITFAASGPEAALRFYDWWEARTAEWHPGTTLLTIQAVRKPRRWR